MHITLLLVPQPRPITMYRSPLISITHGEYEFLNHNRLIPRVQITPFNSEQRILISPQRTLANITSENGQWSYTHIMWTLVNCFRNATITGFKERALLLIVWAFLVSIKQRRGPKMQPFRAFNSPADHRLPRLPEVYWIVQWTFWFHTAGGLCVSLR